MLCDTRETHHSSQKEGGLPPGRAPIFQTGDHRGFVCLHVIDARGGADVLMTPRQAYAFAAAMVRAAARAEKYVFPPPPPRVRK